MLSLAQQSQPKPSVPRFRLVGKYELPHNPLFDGTTVGGLSGIDYDPEKDVYYMICDDRSEFNPARYYTARIQTNEKGIDTVIIQAVTTLLQKNGQPYPGIKQDKYHAPDPEAMRYDPKRKQFIWTSEGERIVKQKDTILQNPSINIIKPDGTDLGAFPLPANLRMHATEKGPRQNGVLEGLTFADQYKTLYVSLEEPRYEDGPRADVMPLDAWTRIYKFNTNTRKNTAQYAYKLEPVAYPTDSAGAFKVNGIPDILDFGNNRLLVMERSFSTGRMACTIRIFLADLNGVENVRPKNSLKQNPPQKPVQKALVMNMDELGIYVDNVEGMTFGPKLPNGRRSLVMVADNNFSKKEITQFFLFEIEE
ncbi:Uncharacterized conserved protein [Sediminibacterium ginsengisoli]|uniref:Uncharacterized conserved protein n=2 Tax=Sediminibacterium ginsengisoli TaxID=413434 RepID=A0A1T4MFK5_9BACT|nr:Uncharacterized conserved protein [Sediminibacterium ginsengisoli]